MMTVGVRVLSVCRVVALWREFIACDVVQSACDVMHV